MSTQIFVLAQDDARIELVIGDFAKLKVGDSFARHPIYGHKPWKIIKIFNHEEQEKLRALELLTGFELLSKLFSVP